MASTNTNTDPQVMLSTDVYQISEFIDAIRANHVTDVSETSSMVGMFGYMNEMFSQTLQNTLISVAETSNEIIPTRAKFAKNIISHALNYGITNIMAHPAEMAMMIYMPLSYIEMNLKYESSTGKYRFIFDKDVPIMVDAYEFHLDYDVIITRTENNLNRTTDKKTYTYNAMYNLFDGSSNKLKRKNPLSSITNPYISAIGQYNIDGVEYVAFSAKLHQVSTSFVDKTVLTNNSIENKSITFSFENQLASFEVEITENNKTTTLTPIYRGLVDYTVEDGTWCEYEYIDENTIRILFNRDSYMPGLNAQVRINIQRTEGSNGNFTYNLQFKSSMKSSKYDNYNGMYIIIQPLSGGDSVGGKDKKSIKELQKIIPREASSRGAIINTSDLENFFNSINDDTCKIYFSKKRDNPFERTYYAHILMRKNSNVYPTNTLDAKIRQYNFNGGGDNRNNNLSITPCTKFYFYDNGDGENYASIIEPMISRSESVGYDGNGQLITVNYTINSIGNEVRIYEYISPFLITIDDDLITSYLLTMMKTNKLFNFDSINDASDLQFIATNMNWERKFKYTDNTGKERFYDNKYTMTMTMAQNNNNDYGLIKYHFDDDGKIVIDDDSRVRVFMVLYSDETANVPYRYIEGKLDGYDTKAYVYTFKFELEVFKKQVDENLYEYYDLMDLSNRMYIGNVKNIKSEEFQTMEQLEDSHGYFKNNTYAKIFIMADFGYKVGDILSDRTVVTEDKVILYPPEGDNAGNRQEIENILPIKSDIITAFLRNQISVNDNGRTLNVYQIIINNEQYLLDLQELIGSARKDESAVIGFLSRYIASREEDRDESVVNFVNKLIEDPLSQKVINNYVFEDLSRYTLCNVLTVDEGVDFYYDYSNMMTSVVNIDRLRATDDEGNDLYHTVVRTDDNGYKYEEYIPVYLSNGNKPVYDYTIHRIPFIKAGFLNTEEKMSDFIADLEQRRRYINICLENLEDTFKIDLKFFNTYGPSRRFFYSNSGDNYRVITKDQKLPVLTTPNGTINSATKYLPVGSEVIINKTVGIYGYILAPYIGWIDLRYTSKITSYINNVALTMNFAVQIQSSSDRYVVEQIKYDIKEFIEDINNINELHIPNLITLITNNYREQIVYFEFLGVNGYGPACQHLYMKDVQDVDVTPEFLNIAMSDDAYENPLIDISINY